MNITRRKLIGAGIVIATAGFVGLRYKQGTVEDAVATIIKGRLNYLKLDESGVKTFAHELAVRNAISPGKLRATSAMGSLYMPLSHGTEGTFIGKALLHGEERVTTLYLLSSDFFWNGADVSKVVHYTRYYDPTIACGNPFARLSTSTS